MVSGRGRRMTAMDIKREEKNGREELIALTFTLSWKTGGWHGSQLESVVVHLATAGELSIKLEDHPKGTRKGI